MPKIIYKQRHIDDNSKRKFSASRNSHYALYIGSREHVLKKTGEERSDEKYSETHEHMARLAKYMGEREHAARKCIDKQAEEKEHEKILVSDRLTDEELLSEDERQYNEQMNDERDNGLFGYIGGRFSDEYSMRDVQSYIRRISEEHNVFHSIYSFTPESAAQAGLNSLDDWENWVKYHINEIARGMNMKIEDIEYIAAVHLKEGQPHVHIEWWNKEQRIFINKVDQLVCDSIRTAAIKSTFREEFTDLHNKEDALVKELRGLISEQTDSMLTALAPDDYTETIAKALNHIGDILPKRGQLAYGYLPADIKAEIDKLTHYIIDNNPQFSKLYNDVLELRRLYNEMLHNADGDDSSNWSKYKLAKYMGRLNDDIEKAVGNTLLKIIKRERKAGRQRMIDAMDSVPIPDEPHGKFNPGHWMEKSQRETFDDDCVNADDSKLYIRWSDKFKAAREAAKSGDHEKAFKLYSEEAKAGNAPAEYEIADMYRRSLIGGEDKSDEHYSAALAGFLKVEQTAEKMKPYLQYRIGRMYYDGYGTEQDFTEALKWLELSARGGNHLSEYTVAKMYRDGKGTERDPEKAAAWFEKAAESDNAYAMYSLAKLYIKGDIPKDHEAAFRLLERAKELDESISPLADYTIGAAYMFDEDIRDRELAEKYLTLSAQAGNEYAQNLLDKSEAWRQNSITDLLRTVYNILETNSRDGEQGFHDAASAIFGRGDLSREAIAELIYKLQDKQNTAEM